MNIIQHLKERNLLFQSTPEDDLLNHLEEKRFVYSGFDPTAESLHVGHLLPLIILKKFKEFGHKIIPLVGDFTASIGDPTGKSKERIALSNEVIKNNSLKISKQISNLLNSRVISNIRHTELGILDFLDVAKSFNVRNMLNSECFKTRLDSDNGLSFLEMSYMLFQAKDFLNLSDQFNCTVQIGGSDQWANMTAGIDLIRKKRNKSAFCITCPLFLDKNGRKMGKTESGSAIWLDKTLTSDFEFFQFWRNIDDDVTKLTAIRFTDIPLDEIENENINIIKEKMACSITEFVRGIESAKQCLEASKSLSNKNIENCEKFFITEQSISILNLIVKLKFVPSKNEGRKLIQNNGLKINNKTINDNNLILNLQEPIIISKGKKQAFQVIYKGEREDEI